VLSGFSRTPRFRLVAAATLVRLKADATLLCLKADATSY
jgi:hypothetical protein